MPGGWDIHWWQRHDLELPGNPVGFLGDDGDVIGAAPLTVAGDHPGCQFDVRGARRPVDQAQRTLVTQWP